MSRQIQIRRGTAAEHENFTGAIGEITMDTDAKTLRVHDGETAGGIALARADQASSSGGDATLPEEYDYVVESASNLSGENYTSGWYRKYKSGWVEQGGQVATLAASIADITLPVPMAGTLSDGAYFATVSAMVAGSNARIVQLVDSSSATTLKVVTNSGFSVLWEVKGFAAA